MGALPKESRVRGGAGCCGGVSFSPPEDRVRVDAASALGNVRRGGLEPGVAALGQEGRNKRMAFEFRRIIGNTLAAIAVLSGVDDAALRGDD